MGPTIVIGLGGFGSEIVSMIQKILDVQDSYQHKQDKMVKLAIVDTDVSGLRERKRDGFRGTIIQISDNMTVEKYLQYDKEAKNTWFPSCQILSKKSLTEGAGQVRAISRLALNMALQKRSFYPLYEEIDKLHLLSEYNTEQATRVIIVSSLAGGTGSGIFLPLAMHLQDYLRRTYRNTEPLFKGFFIMPSVFEYVVKGGAERKSLRANAYAAIKELNAFTLMRDRQLDPKNYPQMKIELMDDQGGKQIYRSSPYDLCFLFEKQNRLDKHLSSYDDNKENIAECIWMQTLNPLLELTGSMEDNLYKIVSTTDGKQYERFAGMGISRIQYPYAELRNYISIVTANRVIGDKWYAADKDYQNSKMEFEDMEDISRENTYIKYSENTEDEYWRERIDHVIKKKWVNTYIESVEKLCITELEKSSLMKKLKDMDDEIGRSINNGEAWSDAYNNLRSKYEKLCSTAKEVRTDILQNLYQRLEPKIEKNKKKVNKEDYKLERWLTGITNTNTPVENRYFLYKLCEELKKHFEQLEEEEREERKKVNDEIEAFEKGFEDWEDIKGTIRVKSMKKEKEREITNHMKTAKDAKINQVKKEIKYKVYLYLFDHASNIAKEYEKLLDKCNELVNIEEKKLRENLEIRFNSSEGCVTRMVCISPKCLKKIKGFIESNMMKINSIDRFAEMLYEKAVIPLKGEKSKKYLLDFWFEQYKSATNGKDPLDVDVLTALKNEAIWEKDLDENNLDSADLVLIEEYIENVIALVRDVFSNSFIRVPDVRQWHIMEMNTYPAEVPTKEEDALLANIVKERIKGNGGVQHEKMLSPRYIESKEGSPKYQIDFYRAFFGIAAGEVSAFLNPEEGSPIRSGESFDAYADIIHRLDNVNQEDNFLSPHIDKNWHKISQMPELSEERDKERKTDLLEALFFGLIKEIIKKNDTEFEISEKIDKRNFLKNDYKIKTFSELVKYTDESPFIIYGLLKQLENETQYGMEQLTVNWEKLKSLKDEIIKDYCEEQEEHGSSKNEAEENIWEAWRRLVFQIQIQPYGYTGIKALDMMCKESCGLTDKEETRIWLKRKFEKRK